MASGAPSPLTDIDPADWDLIIETRLNVLLSGAPLQIDRALFVLRRHLHGPIHQWHASIDRIIPALSTGTLIVEGVAACTHDQQSVLLKGLEDPSRSVRLISTTDRPLFPLVERGVFSADLYYRLNALCIELDGSPPALPIRDSADTAVDVWLADS